MLKIEVIGNLGGDAEVKTDNGRSYVQFSVANTRRFTREDGTRQEETTWISCFYRQADSEVIKYLKRGVRVFVRGNGETRLFSSAKDRMMKAGLSVNVTELELVGGGSEDVPRELALSNGRLLQVNKAYYVDLTNIPVAQRPLCLYGRRGEVYNVDNNGFILGSTSQQTSAAGQQTSAAGQQTSAAGQQTSAAGQQASAAGQQASAAGQQTSAAGQQTSAAGDGLPF